MTESDLDLIAAVAEHDPAACRTIVDRHGGAVYHLALRMVRSTDSAEAVTRDTFLKAFRRLPVFDRRLPLRAWLLRIAYNTALDALRQAPAPPTGSHADPAGWRSLGVDDSAMSLRRRFAQAIDRLRPSDQVALVLRYHEELTFHDVAQVMGVPEGTARTYVRRARRELADRLGADPAVSLKPLTPLLRSEE